MRTNSVQVGAHRKNKKKKKKKEKKKSGGGQNRNPKPKIETNNLKNLLLVGIVRVS